MFVHYDGPSSKRSTKTRRAVNAFKAARGASRSHGKHDPARGTFQWMHIPEDESTGGKDASSPTKAPHSAQSQSQALVRPAAAAPLTKYLLGSDKFYPILEKRGKGPLTAAALSHYFDILLPHDANALGLGDARKTTYGAGLLNWLANNDGVLHGLAAFALCSMDNVGKTDEIYRAILHHRQKTLEDVHRRLERNQVDDVLIQEICLLIPIDDYLGYVEYGPVQQKGMSDVIRARGGFDKVGSSDVVAYGENLQRSILTVMSMIEFHIRTRITSEPSHVRHSIPLTRSLSLETQQQISALPPGLQDLFQAGILSLPVLPILNSFQAWLAQFKGIKDQERDSWRSPVPPDLNNIENCLVVTLVCLADDTSSMGLHPAAAIFRKAKQRTEALTGVPELWSDPALVDCAIWMSTVTSIPRNSEIIEPNIQKEILKRSIGGRVFALEWGEIQRKLRRFYYADSRAGDWERAWNIALDEL
ncbi:hypothetical protein ASPCAL01632 [Aspergillus calidoustus]|uniref:Uncharacterized protein n=2 Tax=Aspergillus calidoustus TaxID=454130 RepID=A0A0U5C3S8_ASPCI|nr:hypothetical protein ASPCAL01632 [Aspergillus calidoustus]